MKNLLKAMSTTFKTVLTIALIVILAGVAYLVGRGSGAIEHSVQFSINVSVSGDFAIDINPKDVTCTKGQVLTFNIAATLSGGFDADIQLVVGGLPEGSYTLGASVLNPTALTTTLTVNTALLESNSTYTCTLSAHDL